MGIEKWCVLFQAVILVCAQALLLVSFFTPHGFLLQASDSLTVQQHHQGSFYKIPMPRAALGD